MEKKVHTHRPGDAGDTVGELCQCQDCGVVREHTPEFDFYTRPEDPAKKLYCESCLIRPYTDGDPSRFLVVEMDEPPSQGDTIIIDDEEDEGPPGSGLDEGDDPADWWKKGG